MRKISHEDLVNDAENVDDYDGITVVMIVVAVVVEVTMLSIWRQ